MIPALALWLALSAAQTASPPPISKGWTPPATTTPPPATPGAPSATPAPAPPPPPATDANSACAPSSNGAYRGSIGMTPPRLIHSEDPVFSAEARQAHISGAVIALIVDAKGEPTHVRVVHSAAAHVDKSLQPIALTVDHSAIDAIQKYRFEPATCNDKKVPYELNVSINVDYF